MSFPKLLLGLLLLSVCLLSIVASADSRTPLIRAANIISNGPVAIVEIRGKHFGNDASAVQVMVNDNGTYARVISARPKVLQVELPADKICTGTVILRVLVNKVVSNPAAIDYAAGSPAITAISPTHAQAGAIIEIKGSNLSCNTTSNLVSFNNISAQAMAVSGNSLTVRVPEALTAGHAEIKLNVNGSLSAPQNFTIDAALPDNGDDDASNAQLQFVNQSGIPGSAGFAPMFANKDNMLISEGNEASLWDANFYGTHQAVVNVPWKTIDGQQQVALVTLNCGHSNSLVGNPTQLFEKFVYMRINYPLHPELPYDSDTNPFWWGASSLCTEHLPHGDIYYNSITSGTGGIESYSMSRAIPGQGKFSMVMRLVAPDVGSYEEYGANFAKAGNGKVQLPKVTSIRLDLDQIETRIPAPRYNFGNVTVIDESGTNGSFKSENARFYSDVITVNGQPQL